FSKIMTRGSNPSAFNFSLNPVRVSVIDPSVRSRCRSSVRFKTNVPLPFTRFAQPFSSISKSAFRAVVLLTPYRLIISFSDGILSPGRYSPFRIRSTMSLLIEVNLYELSVAIRLLLYRFPVLTHEDCYAIIQLLYQFKRNT